MKIFSAAILHCLCHSLLMAASLWIITQSDWSVLDHIDLVTWVSPYCILKWFNKKKSMTDCDINIIVPGYPKPSWEWEEVNKLRHGAIIFPPMLSSYKRPHLSTSLITLNIITRYEESWYCHQNCSFEGTQHWIPRQHRGGSPASSEQMTLNFRIQLN